MDSNAKIKYFLGANSPDGFYSLYSELIDPATAQAFYIIKGGPGCGKSTLMRRVGAALEAAGCPVEYICCSGDPDSLDGILAPTLGVALADGTAPHVIEPKYPGAVETYVDLGQCYDRAALYPMRQALMDCMSGYKECYQRAYRCLGAAAEIRRDMRSIVETPALEQKLLKRARGIAARELKKTGGSHPGTVKRRFLGAVTHQGPLCFFDTAELQCKRIYELSDSYGTAHTMLASLLAGAVAAGHDVVACPSPMAPDRLEHLLIPSLSLAFLSSSPALPYTGRPYRRIRLDAMADGELLRQQKPRLRFARKVSAALIEEAVDSLSQAKAMHDELESLYNPHVDFTRVASTASTIAAEILALPR